MSKLSALKKATGLGAKEEEKKDEQISQDTNAVEQKPSADKETAPDKEKKDSSPEKTDPPKADSKNDEKSVSKGLTQEDSKNDAIEKSTPATPPQTDAKNDTKTEEGAESDEKKRGRKKGIRRDRVIVMLDKETIEVLDSFAISRSGTARAVILASQDFLVNLEGEFKEDELIAMIKGKLG